jgi:hypothetical protein
MARYAVDFIDQRGNFDLDVHPVLRGVDLGGRRIIKKKKTMQDNKGLLEI